MNKRRRFTLRAGFMSMYYRTWPEIATELVLTYGVSLRAQDTQRVCGLTIGEQCLLMFNNTGCYVTREKDA